MGTARFGALALLAAVAASASAGLAVLASLGAHVCHHLANGSGGGDDGLCPIVVFAAALAGGLCLLALLGLAASRNGAPELVVEGARLVARRRIGPLTALLGIAGLLPLGAILASEGTLEGPVALGGLGALLGGALLTAVAFTALARAILTFAERVVEAVAAAFRLLLPGGGPPWRLSHEPILFAGGVRLGRRAPSRAPPLRF